jgi:tRNA(Ile)-lysidine synthase
LSARVEDVLRCALQAWHTKAGLSPPTPINPLLIAYSGGLDSTALLNVAHGIWPTAVRAVHINHGLQAQASNFEAHCREWCAQKNIPFSVVKGIVVCEIGESVEEQARLFRYQELAVQAHQVYAQAVLLAQHADDQAETFLLALTRGAGLGGLSGMGAVSVKHGVVFGRPWLEIRQSLLREWVSHLGWPFIDDPSNSDTRYTRNKIRHELLPKVEQLFPSFVTASLRSARHCAQADVLLHELAQEDLGKLVNEDGHPLLRRLQGLTTARLALVLRLWLKKTAGRVPSTAQLDELSKQVFAARTRGHHIRLKVVDGYVVLENGYLVFKRTL